VLCPLKLIVEAIEFVRTLIAILTVDLATFLYVIKEHIQTGRSHKFIRSKKKFIILRKFKQSNL